MSDLDLMNEAKGMAIHVLSEEAWIGEQNAINFLETKTPTDTLIILINWLSRLVHAHPRRVFVSDQLRFRHLSSDNITNLEKLQNKIERGDDVAAHLSRRTEKKFKSDRAARSSEPHLDALLNDWGIHHLHLSNEIGEAGFVRRGGDLLFVIFTREAAYCLDVMDHGSWTNTDLVRTAVRQWPSEELFHQLAGLKADKLTDEQHKALRSKNVASIVDVDGEAYVSRTYGQTTAGTSARTTMQVIHLQNRLIGIQNRTKANPAYARELFGVAGELWPTEPAIRVALGRHALGYCIILHEQITGLMANVFELTGL